MKIISRAAWGARPFTPERVTWPDGVPLHVHHTAGPQNQAIKDIESFHLRKGWSAIGYSYLVDVTGRVYEGRGPNVRGAHSKPVNDQPSVALIGDFSVIGPSKAQRLAVWELLDHLKAGRLRGHRDSWPTSCPGDAAYAAIVARGRPRAARPEPPDGDTLRLAMTVAGSSTARAWTGWADAGNALRWIAARPGRPAPDTKVALAWRRSVFRYDPAEPGVVRITDPDGATRAVKGDSRYIRQVATTLVERFLP